MTRFWSLGLLALSICAVSTPQSHAWLNWKFGIGANFGYQSGGNNTLWGLFRNGQPPGPGVDPCCPSCPMGPYAPRPGMALPPPPPPAAAAVQPGGACPSATPWFPYPYPFPHYGPGEFQFFGKNYPQTPPHMAPGAVNTVQSGYYNPFRPVSYVPYTAHYYRYGR